MNKGEIYDKNRRPIHVGDILKVFHYVRARNRKRMYMYKQVVRLGKICPNGTHDYLHISHLGLDDQCYYEFPDGRVLDHVEIVQSIDPLNDAPEDRPALRAIASTMEDDRAG